MRTYKLLSTTGDQTVELTDGSSVIVGRAVTSDLPVYDPTVSRQHAELTLVDAGVLVCDKGSANGTFLNGAQISEDTAVDGDIVTFGRVAFKVVEVTPAEAAPPEPESMDFAAPPPDATIVKQVVVPDSGGFEAQPEDRPSSPQLQVDGETPEEFQARKLRMLLDISQALSRQKDVDKLLDKVVDITFQVMSVDRVSILMVEGEELVPRISRNRLGDGGSSRHVPQSIARQVVEQRLAILTDNAAADARFAGKSIVVQSVRSAMCAPLLGGGQGGGVDQGKVIGLIYVDSQTSLDAFGDEDLEFLIAFSGIAAVAIENSQLIDQIQREAVVLSNFQRYFAPNLAEQIADQEEEVRLGGTKRPVVVFFSDIRGFTAMSEKMGPDDIATLLNEYFTEMVEIVFDNGGTLDKFMGDAVMALWGAPITHEDDADRAMKAAIEMQSVLAQLNVKWAAQGRQRVEIGIGIDYYEVFAGNIGSDRRLEYTVIGDAVNTASRLCSKAGAGEIIISQRFYDELKNQPAVDPEEALELKGKEQKVPVYRVKR